jgi:hypothetical protein
VTETYEARGPHLPDVLTRQSPWVYLFVGAALVHVAAAWWDWSGHAIPNPQDLLSLLSVHGNDALISLFGAALFIHHPDARKSMPFLAFGLGLLALGPLLQLVDTPVTQFIDSLAPSDAEFIGLSPAVVAYHVFTSLIGIAGVLYVGAGLGDARTRPRRSVERSVLSLLLVIGILSVAWQVLPIGGAQAPGSPYEWVLLGIGVVLSLLYTLAWSYLIAVAFGGWIAGEEPQNGWGLAFVAGLVGLLLRVFGTISLVIVNLTQAVSSPLSPLFPIIGIASTVGWALWLAAFAVGLPAGSSATADPPEATPPGSEAG